jgi:hypothetical protein
MLFAAKQSHWKVKIASPPLATAWMNKVKVWKHIA